MAVLSTWLADGAHAGLRWWVERVDGAAAPVVTTIGFVGSTYVTERCELPGWTEAAVCRWVDELIAARSAKAARRARA